MVAHSGPSLCVYWVDTLTPGTLLYLASHQPPRLYINAPRWAGLSQDARRQALDTLVQTPAPPNGTPTAERLCVERHEHSGTRALEWLLAAVSPPAWDFIAGLAGGPPLFV